MTYHQILLFIDVGWTALMSLITVFSFAHDKKKAERGLPRTRESTLLALTVFNGALGALFGRLLAHHKTEKIYFTIVIYTSLFFQTAIGCFLGFMAYGKIGG